MQNYSSVYHWNTCQPKKMNKSNNSILEAEIGLPCHSHLFNEGGG